MFSRTVPENRMVSCATIPIWLRKDPRLTPSLVHQHATGSRIVEARNQLDQRALARPLRPTRATTSPGLMRRSIPASVGERSGP